MPTLRYRGRGLVEGRGKGRALVVRGDVSFFGDVDPDTGLLRGLGERVTGRVLIFRRGRGSTVGSYIIYALAENKVAPAAMVVVEAEPIVVTGCVLASIPLVDGVDPGILYEVVSNDIVEVDGSRGEVIVERPADSI